MYERHNSNQGHYFETGSPATGDEVIRALKQAGIEASEYRAVLPKMGSMVFTEFGISDIWELCSGLTKCDGSCRKRRKRHLRWDELTREQQMEFTWEIIRYMKSLTFGNFRADRHISEPFTLYNVELGDCSRSSGNPDRGDDG